ncbi:MAG: hypothetical protein SGILL_004273, partial [Bacillariaceae sp.]
MMETTAASSPTTASSKKDPLAVLASLASASKDKDKQATAGSPKSSKSKKNKSKKSHFHKKRKRDDEEAEQDAKSPRLPAKGPPVDGMNVFVNNNPSNIAAVAAAEVTLANHQIKERQQLQQQLQLQQQIQHQQQRRLMHDRMVMLENPTLNRLPDSFLGSHYGASAALEHEELQMAALR